MTDEPYRDAPTRLDPTELAALKLAILRGVYIPDLNALADTILDDPSLLDDRLDHD